MLSATCQRQLSFLLTARKARRTVSYTQAYKHLPTCRAKILATIKTFYGGDAQYNTCIQNRCLIILLTDRRTWDTFETMPAFIIAAGNQGSMHSAPATTLPWPRCQYFLLRNRSPRKSAMFSRQSKYNQINVQVQVQTCILQSQVQVQVQAYYERY